MKCLITFVVLLILNSTGFAQVKKKALLVGVGDYPGGQWKDLSSANDLKYLKEALTLQNFTEIKTLVDDKATKDAILDALKELEKNAEPNDIILFHFSGHGQQIQDDNKDETDGWDEALIPYDAKEGFYSIDYKGEKHLRDDEIQPLLDSIRKKIGKDGSLVVTLDACHSGTATRSVDFAVTRGEAIPFKKDSKYTGAKSYVVGDGFADAGANAANMIVLSASSPNQVNYETKDVAGKGVGSLSYALARALSELPKGANYNMLFNRIKSEIQGNFPVQIPMMEGNGKQEIFSNAYTSYDEIIEVRWDNDSTIRVPAGALHGISLGTTIDLYLTTDKKVMQATPIEVGNFETIARTDRKATDKIGYHAKWEATFGVYAADLFINTAKTKSAARVGNQLTGFMSAQQNVTLKNDADFMIEISEKDGNKGLFIELVERGDSVRWSRTIASGDTLSEKDKQSLLADLRHSMKVKFLRSMHDGGSLTDGVKVEIVPAKPKIENNEIKVSRGDAFTIRVTNNSDNDIYYTIINLRPDNKMSVLIPDPGLTPQEFRLKAKSGSYDLTGFTVDDDTPSGQELFKVIVSRTPMDLRNVFNATRSKSGDNMNSFETALQDMVETSTTGTRSGRSNVKLGEVGITTVGFTVLK